MGKEKKMKKKPDTDLSPLPQPCVIFCRQPWDSTTSVPETLLAPAGGSTGIVGPASKPAASSKPRGGRNNNGDGPGVGKNNIAGGGWAKSTAAPGPRELEQSLQESTRAAMEATRRRREKVLVGRARDAAEGIENTGKRLRATVVLFFGFFFWFFLGFWFSFPRSRDFFGFLVFWLFFFVFLVPPAYHPLTYRAIAFAKPTCCCCCLLLLLFGCFFFLQRCVHSAEHADRDGAVAAAGPDRARAVCRQGGARAARGGRGKAPRAGRARWVE
jgi:hypothetical protein